MNIDDGRILNEEIPPAMVYSMKIEISWKHIAKIINFQITKEKKMAICI